AGGAREIDKNAVRDYLMLGYVPAPRSIWRGVQKLEPGTYLRARWRRGAVVEVVQIRFWDICEVPPARSSDDGETDSAFRGKVKAAVESRLVSDVPVGLLLSGGIDSSTIAAACSESS